MDTQCGLRIGTTKRFGQFVDVYSELASGGPDCVRSYDSELASAFRSFETDGTVRYCTRDQHDANCSSRTFSPTDQGTGDRLMLRFDSARVVDRLARVVFVLHNQRAPLSGVRRRQVIRFCQQLPSSDRLSQFAGTMIRQWAFLRHTQPKGLGGNIWTRAKPIGCIVGIGAGVGAVAGGGIALATYATAKAAVVGIGIGGVVVTPFTAIAYALIGKEGERVSQAAPTIVKAVVKAANQTRIWPDLRPSSWNETEAGGPQNYSRTLMSQRSAANPDELRREYVNMLINYEDNLDTKEQAWLYFCGVVPALINTVQNDKMVLTRRKDALILLLDMYTKTWGSAKGSHISAFVKAFLSDTIDHQQEVSQLTDDQVARWSKRLLDDSDFAGGAASATDDQAQRWETIRADIGRWLQSQPGQPQSPPPVSSKDQGLFPRATTYIRSWIPSLLGPSDTKQD